MKSGEWTVAGLVCFAFATGACSGGRDVEVSGTLTATNGLSVGDKVVVDFFDVLKEGSEGEKPDTHRVVLNHLGEFSQTVSLEGDEVDVRALDDRNADGLCSDGEAWGRVTAPIAQDKAAGVQLMLTAQPCWALDE